MVQHCNTDPLKAAEGQIKLRSEMVVERGRDKCDVLTGVETWATQAGEGRVARRSRLPKSWSFRCGEFCQSLGFAPAGEEGCPFGWGIKMAHEPGIELAGHELCR